MADHISDLRTKAKPGAALRALRDEHGWTLADVAKRTGLTISVLSKIENDRIALSFEKLVRISQGLGIDITQLFDSAVNVAPARSEGSSRKSVTRAGEGRAIEMARGNYLYVAADLIKKRMIPIIGDVFAKSIDEYPEYLRHEGEEYVLVMTGTLDLYTETYTPIRLEAGDSIYFDSDMGHAYIAVGDEPCRILSVCATTEARVVEAVGSEAATSEPRRIGPAAKAKAAPAKSAGKSETPAKRRSRG